MNRPRAIATLLFVLLVVFWGSACTPTRPINIALAATPTISLLPSPSPVPTETDTPIPPSLTPTLTLTPVPPSPTASHTQTPTRAPTLLPTRTSTPTRVIEPSALACVITAPPASFGFDPFYKKFCSAQGMPIISADVVPDAALKQIAVIITKVLSARADVRDMMIRNKLRVGIVGAKQVMTDMPEYRNLYTQFPGTDWNKRARGLGGTTFIPLVTGAEENLLCYTQDVYRGENILVHEFAHTIVNLGLKFTDAGFQTELQSAYDQAKAAGLWANTYAGSNTDEYWAVGVQDYFNTNRTADPPDGIYNFVHTRAQLRDYDSRLYALIDNALKVEDWTPTCPL